MLNVAVTNGGAQIRQPNGKFGPRPIPLAPETEWERMRAWLADRINAATPDNPLIEPVTMTPVLAQLLLERNVQNRNISNINLERIKKDLITGNWKFNGETIIIAEDGTVNDGQHRIRGVLETGRSMQTVLVFGPTRESRLTLDQGVARTIGGYLALQGHKRASMLGSLATMVYYLKTFGTADVFDMRRRPTKSDVMLVVQHYKDLDDSLEFCARAVTNSVAFAPFMAFCHWAFCQASRRELADEFIDKLITGAGLQEGNPILYARNRLLMMKGTRNRNAQAQIVFKCWNTWRNGEGITSFVRAENGRLPDLIA